MEDFTKNIDRRNFMKLAGAGVAGAAISATLGGCDNSKLLQTQTKTVPADKMTYRTDPKNGNKLSLLGFGMMRLPRVQRKRGESLPDTNDLDQEAVNELVDYAIAHGVNLFDTSPVYCKGFSEKATGEALSRHPRDKYYIATKMSNSRPPHAKNREESIKIYHRSFEDLKVDYIDYYFVHNVGNNTALNERYIDNGMLDFMFKEKEAGRVKNIGWSFHGDGDFFEYMAGAYPWDFTMIQLNYLDWNVNMGGGGTSTNISARRQYEILTEKEIPVWIMEPLLGGVLSMPHYKARERMMQADSQASAASWAFRFAGGLPNVTTVLSGMMFMDHLQDNIRTYSPLTPLNDSENEMLLGDVSRIAMEYRNINCTKCQYCMPCPYGIDIPEIFSHFNRSLNEGNYPDDRQSDDYKRARRAYLVGMDRNVSPLRQASRCINCDLCISACPQRINIPREMRRIDEFSEKLRTEV
ncbi:MAG: aldo/keto reductase [Chitinivibrionia bacterium]|nr:aldo/keto reductase [Chitinivibrionia bacterium]